MTNKFVMEPVLEYKWCHPAVTAAVVYYRIFKKAFKGKWFFGFSNNFSLSQCHSHLNRTKKLFILYILIFRPDIVFSLHVYLVKSQPVDINFFELLHKRINEMRFLWQFLASNFWKSNSTSTSKFLLDKFKDTNQITVFWSLFPFALQTT